MLRTRLWMGTVLILLVLGVLLLDGRFAPYFPFLLVLLLALALIACRELLALLGPRRPWPWLCYLAVVVALFVPKCCDIGAYFTGRFLGKHKMAPVLSPKKTWEGLAGGLVLGM